MGFFGECGLDVLQWAVGSFCCAGEVFGFVGEGVSSVWGRCMVLSEVCLWKWVGFMGVWCWPGGVWVG